MSVSPWGSWLCLNACSTELQALYPNQWRGPRGLQRVVKDLLNLNVSAFSRPWHSGTPWASGKRMEGTGTTDVCLRMAQDLRGGGQAKERKSCSTVQTIMSLGSHTLGCHGVSAMHFHCTDISESIIGHVIILVMKDKCRNRNLRQSMPNKPNHMEVQNSQSYLYVKMFSNFQDTLKLYLTQVLNRKGLINKFQYTHLWNSMLLLKVWYINILVNMENCSKEARKSEVQQRYPWRKSGIECHFSSFKTPTTRLLAKTLVRFLRCVSI